MMSARRFISRSMSNIDQSVRAACAHVGNITAHAFGAFGD
jgi:hypothetical protein